MEICLTPAVGPPGQPEDRERPVSSLLKVLLPRLSDALLLQRVLRLCWSA